MTIGCFVGALWTQVLAQIDDELKEMNKEEIDIAIQAKQEELSDKKKEVCFCRGRL